MSPFMRKTGYTKFTTATAPICSGKKGAYLRMLWMHWDSIQPKPMYLVASSSLALHIVSGQRILSLRLRMHELQSPSL